MNEFTRRRLLALGLAASTLPLAASAALGQARRPATPACDDEPTPSSAEGPFFTPRSPRRASLIEAGIGGRRFLLEGQVLDTACRPVAGAAVDLWHADDHGEYDNDGYRLRGHQFTDDAGRYRFETIVPGRYGSRTRHYHIKVGPPAGPLLTTQLYFPGEPGNARDFLFRPDLLMAVADGTGRFDFVLA